MNDTFTLSKYDRLYGGLQDVSLFTKPSTIENVQSITGKTDTFVIQTCRHEENGDYIFIECMDESGVVRLALPPKVANIIASQRESLTKRRRSISSRASMQARMAAGEVIGFKKKRAPGLVG
jgi:hypothetical protein